MCRCTGEAPVAPEAVLDTKQAASWPAQLRIGLPGLFLTLLPRASAEAATETAALGEPNYHGTDIPVFHPAFPYV